MGLYLVNNIDMSVRLEPIVALKNCIVHGFEVLSKVDEVYNVGLVNGFDYESTFAVLSDDEFLSILIRQFEVIQKWVGQHPEIYSGKVFYFNIRRSLVSDNDFTSMLIPFCRTYEMSLEFDCSEFNDLCAPLSDAEKKCFEKMQDMGVGIWIDDYYGRPLVINSNYIEGVKVDRKYFWKVFLMGNYDFLNKDSYISKITKNIIIEGIETEEQHEFSIKSGSTLGQGYLWKEIIIC
ncbi:EAL domain-containing protein [Aeromonas veronii]